MSLGDLDILKQHRQDLLLAEVAAWLHDVGKCADEHIINQASNKPSSYSYSYKTAQSHRLPNTLPPICLLGDTVTVKALIEKGMPGNIGKSSQPWLLRVLGKCHAAAHVEKELDVKDQSTKQPKDDTRLSSAFGVEGNSARHLTSRLLGLPFASMENRSAFVPHVEKTFDSALGDTRRPVNEVTLADWSGAVAALYKSALAGALLGVKPDPDDLRWRLLRVNFDVLDLYAKAVKIGDLLGYQDAVEEACKQVKQLVEEEYPLGNEVYRDTTGIYFTFPNLDLPDALEQDIRRRVEAVEPELPPRIAVTVKGGATAVEQLKGILGKARREARQALEQPFDAHNLSPGWQQQWESVGAGNWEVCPVCRLRPKRESDEVCAHCEERRQPRLKAWRDNPEQTIWLAEIADHNDRVALLVGKFGLDDWLSGELVQTMLVKADSDPAKCVPKNPSPARLRRVWETCQRFWSETVQQEILAKHNYGEGAEDVSLRRWRYRLIPDRRNGWKENFAYNGTIEGKDISLLWRQTSGDFLTISNLQMAGVPKAGQTIRVSLSDTPPRVFATFKVENALPVEGNFACYQPCLTLLASPDHFLAFIPAAEALAIADKIRDEFQKHFGKVQNRLPLFLGLVFFPRKMPLAAVMDTARQMLAAPSRREAWTVKQFANDVLLFGNGIEWRVSTKMGDDQTEDRWYPYFELDGTPAAHHRRRFERDGKTWVHVSDLEKGDKVRVIPSTFDFEFLDAAARRFEIHYDENGRRPRRTRPFYLEDLERFDKLWDEIQHLTQTQFKQILQSIETTRERWFGPDEQGKSAGDDTFKQFVADTLAAAAWPKSRPWKSISQQEELITAGQRGLLVDLAELHLEILKEDLRDEKHKEDPDE
jgi:hypothetical protein